MHALYENLQRFFFTHHSSQASDTPFQVPNELRDEIAQFESELTDEDIFWTSCIYE